MPNPWDPSGRTLMPGTGMPTIDITRPVPGLRPIPRGPDDPAPPSRAPVDQVVRPGVNVGVGPEGGLPNIGAVRLPYQQRDGGFDFSRMAASGIGLMTGLPGGLLRGGAEWLAQRDNFVGRSAVGQRIRNDMYERKLDDYTRDQMREDARALERDQREAASGGAAAGGGGNASGGPRPGAGRGTTIAEGKAAQTMAEGMRAGLRAQDAAAQFAKSQEKIAGTRK